MQKTAGTRACQKFTASKIDEIPADCKGKIVNLTLPDTSYQAGRSMSGGGGHSYASSLQYIRIERNEVNLYEIFNPRFQVLTRITSFLGSSVVRFSVKYN